MDILQTLSDLTAAFGPSGCEDGVARSIERIAKLYCDEVTRDVMGNLICHKRGTGPRVMFSAHMDSIGLVATHIDEKGFVRVGPVGGVGLLNVLYTPVRFQNGTCGVLCVSPKADRAKLKGTDVYVDVGATSREDAQRLVRVGDVAVYDTRTTDARTRIISPYMDNRVSCLVLLMAMERLGETDNDLYFVFTVQEEVGIRGAKTAAWSIDPDYGIAVDVTGADDVPDAKHMACSHLSEGAAVCIMNRSVICHPKMVDKLFALAAEREIKVQRDATSVGGTDAGAIHLTRGGVYTGGISIPCRYVHTPMEMVDKEDIKACAALVTAFAEAKLEKEC